MNFATKLKIRMPHAVLLAAAAAAFSFSAPQCAVRAPGMQRARPVVLCDSAISGLRAEIDALRADVKRMEERASTSISPDMELMAELNGLREQLAAKEEELKRAGVKRYSAVGRMRQEMGEDDAWTKKANKAMDDLFTRLFRDDK